jgi:ribosomal protein S18 acetylase RimI-like enzyme
MQIRIASQEDIPAIKKIAEKTWHVAYQSLLEEEQITFMLEEMYSTEALERQFKEGDVFLVAQAELEVLGFCSYRNEGPEIVRIPKLYVLPRAQKKGVGKQLIAAVATNAKKLGAKILELNVKRDNPSLHFYLNLGFEVHKEEDISYHQYVLKDYVMRKTLS